MNIGVENGLEGVVNLVNMKAYYFDGDSGRIVVEKEIPDGLLQFCKDKKIDLLGQLAEFNEELENYYLEEDINVPEDMLKAIIRENTINLNFAPVFMGSAFKNKGV